MNCDHMACTSQPIMYIAAVLTANPAMNTVKARVVVQGTCGSITCWLKRNHGIVSAANGIQFRPTSLGLPVAIVKAKTVTTRTR